MIGGRGDALRDTRADDLCHCRLLVKSLHPVVLARHAHAPATKKPRQYYGSLLLLLVLPPT